MKKPAFVTTVDAQTASLMLGFVMMMHTLNIATVFFLAN